MPGKVVHYKTIGTVTFFKNRRSKNIKISVKPDKSVLVSFPFYCTSKEVIHFLEKNEAWIQQQQQKMELQKTRIHANSIINTKQHSVFFLLGEKYDFKTKESNIHITVKDFESEYSKNFIEDILTQIY